MCCSHSPLLRTVRGPPVPSPRTASKTLTLAVPPPSPRGRRHRHRHRRFRLLSRAGSFWRPTSSGHCWEHRARRHFGRPVAPPVPAGVASFSPRASAGLRPAWNCLLNGDLGDTIGTVLEYINSMCSGCRSVKRTEASYLAENVHYSSLWS